MKEKAVIEKQSDICEENWMLYIFFLMPHFY